MRFAFILGWRKLIQVKTPRLVCSIKYNEYRFLIKKLQKNKSHNKGRELTNLKIQPTIHTFAKTHHIKSMHNFVIFIIYCLFSMGKS